MASHIRFIPLPRLEFTRIALNPSVQQVTDVYPPANYYWSQDGICFECPHCHEEIDRNMNEGIKLVNVGVYTVVCGFHHCPSCAKPVFTVSPSDVSKYWSK